MSIRIALHHQTVYQYDRLISLGPQTIRLRPAPHCRTPVASYSLTVEPAEHFMHWQQDPMGNYQARVTFPQKTRQMSVTVDLIADMTVINPFDFFLEPSAETFPFQYEPSLEEELKPFLAIDTLGPKLEAFMAPIDRSKQTTIDFLVGLNQRVQNHIQYLVRMEPGVQTCEETLTLGCGSCRDSAWLLVQIMRRLGLATRFVSGYLIQLTPDVKSLDGPVGTDRDFTDLHAWAEVYLPGAGWIGLDPTSGLMAGEGHLPLAATPNPTSAAPISGALEACETKFNVAMEVTRIHEDPRVTKPYSSAQWDTIEKLGHTIDKRLVNGDVRLTMGGEPTFVSIDDMEGAEWNITAMGPDKRKLAGRLFKRMRDQFATGALLHYGMGKWYPGEPLPRWAMTCLWRADGQPIWHNPELLADDEPHDKQHRMEPTHAKQFAEALARRLGIDPTYAQPAYEDPQHYLAQEEKLPINVDPLDNRLENPEDRARLSRVFKRGLTTPAGYVLPLQRISRDEANDVKNTSSANQTNQTNDSTQNVASDKTSDNQPEFDAWLSGRWLLRSKHICLIPGDSPMGLRLPLSELPWVDPKTYHPDHEFVPDPMSLSTATPLKQTTTGKLNQSQIQAQKTADQSGEKTNAKSTAKTIAKSTAIKSDPDKQPAHGESANWVVRTAACVEARQGKLHVFMPPTRTADDYLALIHEVEQTAQALQMPVVIEGYTPPFDPRIKQFGVTPDPGVIEVNIHPAHSWKELVEHTTTLYSEARQARLGTEKFMLDGRHSGTGGGNHVVLGGATPADSPFLRRPDLLKSMIGYWLNHPSLSYLFSGLFIGPTSQAPRVDEARHEAVYELETAFEQIPDANNASASPCPPWLIDRALRHLLTDLTGNTHRAEFCIDKLYAPETATGRLGLLELRGFEMPPHERMSLTQQLLVRGLIAWFWDKPYQQKPIHWGTRLHDRFMLPHFVADDLQDVIDDLNHAGLGFESSWFDAHFEFRFPSIGQITYQGINIEIRQAIEPWNVLGEEPGAGGTARYVDSSVERVQVKVEGLTEDRYVIACNGRRLPLHHTGTHGQFVAAVRYRAWQPPSCLHPTIPVHAPLVFDVIDSWSGRSIGGCTYHVSHPGGRNYDTFPVNAFEAEARRMARFIKQGHTPGPMETPKAEANRLYPFTLDMRRRGPKPGNASAEK